MTGKLGLIAGGGALPLSVAARCEAEGRPVFVVRLAGFADPHLARYPGVDAGLGEIGRVLSALRKAGCEAVCFAGTVSRPDFKTLKPDFKGMTLLPGIIAEAAKGDDALLRKILSVFEGEGLFSARLDAAAATYADLPEILEIIAFIREDTRRPVALPEQ